MDYYYLISDCFYSLTFKLLSSSATLPHMPELPEVQTTVEGLRRRIVGRIISDVWSDYASKNFIGSRTIKDPAYFEHLRREIVSCEVSKIERRAKNILIYLTKKDSSQKSLEKQTLVLLVHMKMTGHLLYGTYRFDSNTDRDPWIPVSPPTLNDPFNRHIHFIISFRDGTHLALSDVRKFAKVALIESDDPYLSDHLAGIGPEPLEEDFTFERFAERLYLRPTTKIKQALMDQSVIAGIGNIYADESLWRAGIHPLQKVDDIPTKNMRALFTAMKKTLSHGIDFGGDSTSDYRNVDGEKGSFHERHRAYRRTGSPCEKKGCTGTIVRISLGGRGTHFCDEHQKLIRPISTRKVRSPRQPRR